MPCGLPEFTQTIKVFTQTIKAFTQTIDILIWYMF